MNNSYRKERLKLTALYFCIILLIVGVFSVIVIRTQNNQFRRFDDSNNMPLPRGGAQQNERVRPSQEEAARVAAIVEEIKRENLETILFFDALLLVLASCLSYYLSGKTLEPILATLDRQKRFISDASHELKTPLANIMVEAEVLYRDENTSNDEYRGFAYNVMEDVKHLNKLVISLLDTAKLDNHAVQVRKEEVVVSEVLETVAKKFKETAKKKNISISVRIKDPIVLSTDKDLLERVIAIFLDNAIKYNRKNGSVELSVENIKGVMTITIKDNGIGISADEIPKIFNRFHRASEDRNEKGFGLGLSIAKQLCDVLGIKIDVKSEVNKGTSFNLVFV
jgi:two-component system, OmpR family, sensor histidine kinase CiaH